MKIYAFFLFVLAFIGCKNVPDKKKPNSVTGLWSLVSMEVKDSLNNWSDWNGGMQGNLLYDGQGHMSLHLSTKDFHEFDSAYPNFTKEISLAALQHQTNTYYYMGVYKIDKVNQIVQHTRISHSNPKDWGVTVERRFEFWGDTLVIQPVEQANANLRLKWIQMQR